MIKSNNKGITLIALVITIILVLIIASITITATMTGVDESEDQKLETELKMVQHAVLERYTKYSLTKDENMLVGEKVEKNQLPSLDKKWKADNGYYRISKENFSKLGITDIEDTYIVNYTTGEVYNETSTKSSGEKLYIYAVENK